MSFISYAQNGEDVLLHRIFGGQETGFYVDVGAYHPVDGSVTKAFYDRGWAGINVEPGSVFDELAAARPRDVNLRMVVLDRTGTALLRENTRDLGMSRVVEADDASGASEVPCDTLENVVRLHGDNRPVDFLKVDAEGAEAAIVTSTDWRRFRPRVLVFEATLPWSNVLSNADWEPALLNGGYVRAYFDGINCFYLPEETAPVLEQYFRVPINVLDRVERHDAASLAAREAERDESRRALAAAVEAERDKLHGALAEAAAAAEAEREELRRFHAVSAAATAEWEDSRRALAAAAATAEAERSVAQAEQRAAEAQAALLSMNLTVAEGDRTRLAAEHAAAEEQWRSALAASEAERARLAALHAGALAASEAERARLAALHAEAAAHIAAVRESQEVLAAIAQERQTHAPAPAPARYRLTRRMARRGYGLVRPVARPLMHRLRGFLITPQLQAFDALREEVLRIRAAIALVRTATLAVPEIQVVTQPADLTEMRRLAAEMERTVLTLAMESAPSAPFEEPAETPLHSRAPLILPSGRQTEIEHGASDLSVSGAIVPSGGG